MSVLLAYGTSKEAVIMSDSRATYYDDNGNILGFIENEQKIYKITDKFIIGSVGNAKSTNIIKNININSPTSILSNIKNYSYEKFLDFFVSRIKIFGINKLSYSPYIAIGIENGKIRMDTFNNITCNFDPVYPQESDFVSIIYLPPNINQNYKNIFYNGIRTALDEKKYCENTIRNIANIDPTVNSIVQKFSVKI